MVFIVMLSGYMRSGKDTVGEYMTRRHGFKRYAFADILKDEVSKMYHLDRQLLDTQSGKSSEIRQILISHGQMRRIQNPEYWVQKVIQQIKKDALPLVVITDWRFPNEYSTLSADFSPGQISTWRINRWQEPPLMDMTETALDAFSFDNILENTKSSEDLYRKVDKVLAR